MLGKRIETPAGLPSLIAVLCFVAGPAAAGDAYIGAGWGEASFTVDDGAVRADTRDSGYRLYAGYRFNRWLGAEVAFTDLLDGRTARSGVEYDLSLRYGSLAAVGVLPLHPRLELWAKIEAIRWEVDLLRDDGGAAPSDLGARGSDIGYGVGFDWRVGARWGVRGAWERLDPGPIDDLAYASAGLRYRFAVTPRRP